MDKNTLVKMFSKQEDRVLASRLLDKVEQCSYSSFACSEFLSPYETAIAKKIFNKLDDVCYFFTGGYEGAERVIAIISKDFIDEAEMLDQAPLSLLRITPSVQKQMSHRDYLGSLMGLGIKREKIGDILVCEAYADIFVINKLSEYISYNLDKIGNVKVKCELCDEISNTVPTKKEKLIKTTVASLRSDAVASCGFGISRTKVLDYFKSERVNINWEIVKNPSKQLLEGDVISIRGFGRIVLDKVIGTTKKDRISIVIKRYE